MFSKHLIKTAALSLTLIAASAAAALAHDLSNVDRTQSAQIQQIEQARRSGQLTRREYNALIAEQARISRLEADAQRDGYVSGRAYRQIREAQNDASAHIYQESHDGEVNYWRAWKWRHGYRY